MIEKCCRTCVHYDTDDYSGFCSISIRPPLPCWVWDMFDDPSVRDVDPDDDGWNCDTWEPKVDDPRVDYYHAGETEN